MPLFTKIIELNKQKEAPKEVNLKLITNKFGLISKEEIENLPQIAQTTKTDEEIKSDILKAQAEENRKLANEILENISIEPEIKKQVSVAKTDGPSVPDFINIETKFITFDLKESTYHKDFKDYRFWLKLAQKRMEATGNIEDGMDYLRNGIKELPLNPQLLYNFGCANERI